MARNVADNDAGRPAPSEYRSGRWLLVLLVALVALAVVTVAVRARQWSL